MKTLERYVFGSFVSSFLLSFLVLSFVLTIGLMVQIVGYILQGLPMRLVGEFALVSFPETMQWTIPLGLLVAAILVFSRLSADGEIAAMRACGVNLIMVLRWPIIMAFLAVLLGFFINNEIVPRGHLVRRNLARRISVGTGLELLEPGRVIDDFPKLKLYFNRKEGNWLYDLVAMDYSNDKFERMVTATKALVIGKDRDIHLDLHGVTVEPLDEEHPGMARLGRFSHVVKDALKDPTYTRKTKDFRFFEMCEALQKAKVAADAATGSSHVKNTKRYLARRVWSDIATEFSKRFVFASAALCFVLVGVPLGIRAQRKESSIGMAIALCVALGYYMLVIFAMSLSKKFYVHPEWLIWLPVALCIILAARLLPRHL